MKIHALAAAVLLGSTALAAAADAIVDEVVVVDTAYNWSGVYVGGQVGYAFGSADYTYDPNDPDQNDTEITAVAGSGYLERVHRVLAE